MPRLLEPRLAPTTGVLPFGFIITGVWGFAGATVPGWAGLAALELIAPELTPGLMVVEPLVVELPVPPDVPAVPRVPAVLWPFAANARKAAVATVANILIFICVPLRKLALFSATSSIIQSTASRGKSQLGFAPQKPHSRCP